jgi:hypothetical protein
MYRLIASTLIAFAVSLAAGCGSDSDPDPGGGSISVTWSMLTADAAGDAVATDCPADATSAIVYALPEGQTGDPFEDTFLCGDRGGSVAGLPEGRYTVWVRLTDAALVTRFAESSSQIIDVLDGQDVPVPQFDIFVDHGFYTLGWNLRPPGSSGPVSCASIAGASSVSIVVTDGGGALLDTFVDCEEGVAPASVITRPLPSGVGTSPSYTLQVALLDQLDGTIADAAPLTPAETGPLDYGNKVQDLGFIEIDQNWQ